METIQILKNAQNAQELAFRLFPEFGPRKTKHPDAIVDGIIMEFKTVSGNERKIKEKYMVYWTVEGLK